MLACAAPLLAFAVLAEDVVEGRPLGLDRTLSSFVRDNAAGFPGRLGDDDLQLAAFVGVSVAVAVLVALLAKRKLRVALFGVTALGGAFLLETALKDAFHRPGLGAAADEDSFPSGGAMGSMALLAVVVLVVGENRRRLVLGVFGGCLLLAYGASIVYLRWHYPSDVLAGWSLSLSTWVIA